MICPQCCRPYLFIKDNNSHVSACQKCNYSQVFKAPSYKQYHQEKYGLMSKRTRNNDPLLEKIIKKMRFTKNDIVLDFGCGVGDYCFALEQNVQKIIGIDRDITEAKKKFPQLKFQKQQGLKIRFNNNYFDKIISINVIEHIHNYQYVLEEFHRVLKPNGKLFITTYDINFILHSIHYDKTHLIEWSKEGFENLINKYFKVVSSFKYGTFFNYYPLNWVLVRLLKPELCIIAKK